VTNSAYESVSACGDHERVVPTGAQDRHEALLLERYRWWAGRYDRKFASYSERTLDEAARILGDPTPERVLDLACGTGLLIERLLRRDPAVELTGVDISEEMLAQASQRLLGCGRVRLLCGSAERIPVASGSFDAVVVSNAFHLVRDASAALAECRRALRPGGVLVIVDWCRDVPAMQLLSWSLALTQRLRRRILTTAEQQRLVVSAGFEVAECRRFTARPAWGLMSLRANRRE